MSRPDKKIQKYLDRRDLIFCCYLQYFSLLRIPRVTLLEAKLRQRDLESVRRDLEFVKRDLELQPT